MHNVALVQAEHASSDLRTASNLTKASKAASILRVYLQLAAWWHTQHGGTRDGISGFDGHHIHMVC